MNWLRGFAWLLLAQSLGELATRAAGWRVPGPVVGMVVLLSVLVIPSVQADVAAVSDGLLAHLSLLFVPVGVGVVAHLTLMAEHGGRLLVVIVLSTWLGLVVTAAVLRALWRPEPWP